MCRCPPADTIASLQQQLAEAQAEIERLKAIERTVVQFERDEFAERDALRQQVAELQRLVYRIVPGLEWLTRNGPFAGITRADYEAANAVPNPDDAAREASK